MVAGYLESTEGQQEFAKLQQPYAKSLQDELYDQWLHDTDAERLKEYSRHKEKEVSQMRRVQQGDGEEYLVYSFVHYRLDKALNVTHRWRPLAGKYPIPQAEFYVQRTDFGKEERKFKEIVSIEDGYSIPYTKENVDKIKNIGLRSDGKVEYMVETPNHMRLSVASFQDFRNGDFDELAHFGRIPTEAQRKAWREKEGGIEADKQREEERILQIENRDIPQKIPTVTEVKSMIEEAVTKQQVSKEEAEALKKVEVEGKPDERAVKEVNTSKRSKSKTGRPTHPQIRTNDRA